MDYPLLAMIVIGSISFVGAVGLIARQFSVKQYSYTTPKIIRLPEGGSGSCSSDGDCEWGQGALGPQVEAVAESKGDGTNYRVLRTSEINLEPRPSWSAVGIPAQNWPVSVPVKKDAD